MEGGDSSRSALEWVRILTKNNAPVKGLMQLWLDILNMVFKIARFCFHEVTRMSSNAFLHAFNMSDEVLRVLLIFLVAWLLIRSSRRLIGLLTNFLNSRAKTAEENRRIDTLSRVFRYIATVVITLVAGMLALSQFGISIAPILGAAGVVGIAVGFGAQSLVKDYFTGFFLLLENQVRKGDLIEVCGKQGLVEDITLRYVRLRDYDGHVHYIPNGQITLVTNQSCDFAFALIDIGVSYAANLDQVFAVLHDVGRAMQAEDGIRHNLLEPLEVQGVQAFADSSITIRCRFKTVALEQGPVRRLFLKRAKEAFDQHGIEIPYPYVTVVHKK